MTEAGSAGARPAVAFIAWTPTPGRAIDIAAALGGEAKPFYFRRIVNRRLIPIRYLVDSVRSAVYLARRRPRAVVVTHPPIFPALLGYLYARLARVPFVLDSHVMAFGLAGDRLSEVMLPVHSWLAARAAATLVTGQELAQVVEGWGGRPLVVHEPPVTWHVRPPRALNGRPRVLFTGVFARDEPVAEVLAGARKVPDIDVQLTGDPRLCPPGLRSTAPRNVEFLGFLPGDAFGRAIEDSDAVLTLSTERVSVMRTAYEAVYARRPLIVSDRPELRELFPHAVFVDITADGIAAGLREAVIRHDELVRSTEDALALQDRRWAEQLDALRSIVSGRSARSAKL